MIQTVMIIVSVTKGAADLALQTLWDISGFLGSNLYPGTLYYIRYLCSIYRKCSSRVINCDTTSKEERIQRRTIVL